MATRLEQEFTGLIVSGRRELSQRELLTRVAKAANGLSALGIGRNDAVALLLRNDFPFFEATMAANTVGAYAVPINWHFVADEVAYILKDSEAKLLVAHADLLPAIEAAIPNTVKVLVVPTPEEIRASYGLDPTVCRLRPGDDDWDTWVAAQASSQATMPPSPASMIYTSGTTGHPKGVRREHATPENAATLGRMIATIFGIGAGGDFRTVITGPMYHSAPNAYALYAARSGGYCELQPRFDPVQLLEMIERRKITHLHMVPTMFVRLLQLPQEIRDRYDVGSLRFVVHGAAPCAPDVKRRMIDWWGPVINEYYGGTETGGAIFHTAEEALRKPGTVGRPIAGASVHIYDDDGNLLGPKQIGLVYLKTEGLADFTYNKAPEKRQQADRNGMITVGDIGYLDEDGYLFLCDRKNDMIISGGVNIYPAEIEAVLIAMPKVKDCAVFGIPDPQYGEAVCAYVQPMPNETLAPEDVTAFLSQHLAKYKLPKLVEFVPELPREDSGKIFKRKLKAPYWEKLNRNI